MDVIERIERGEIEVGKVHATEVIPEGYFEGSKIKFWVTDDNAKAELLHLAKIGQRMQWVSVGDRLPEHNQIVDVIYDHRRETDVLFTDLGWNQYFWNPEMGRFIDGVTHWMPLPEPPKEGE